MEAEQVEGVAALGRVERAVGMPSLTRQQALLDGVELDRTRPAFVGLAHGFVGQRPRAAQVQRTNAFSQIRIGVGHEPVRRFHEVAVGVVVHTAFGIGHEETLSRAS